MKLKAIKSGNRRPTVVFLAAVAVFFCLALLSIQSSSFAAGNSQLAVSREDLSIFTDFQSRVQQCVANRGLGLTADVIDHCKLVLKFPQGTNSTWYNAQFKIFEPLEYQYDVCEAIILWEQYRNTTTVLTREYLDTRPDGWLEYAAKRIAQLYDA